MEHKNNTPFSIYVLDRWNNLEMAVVCSVTGLYPGKFIFEKTILPISAGQATPTTEIIFLWGFFWLDVNRKYNWESVTTVIKYTKYKVQQTLSSSDQMRIAIKFRHTQADISRKACEASRGGGEWWHLK